jgi:hypothetical protein
MTVAVVALSAGILFLLIAVVGGGFSVREIKIPDVPTWGRLIAAALGLAFILSSYFGIFDSSPPFADKGGRETPTPGVGCRVRKDLPSVSEGNRTWPEVRDFLENEGFHNVREEPIFVNGAPKGVVISQTPSPGTILCPRDEVTLKVIE